MMKLLDIISAKDFNDYVTTLDSSLTIDDKENIIHFINTIIDIYPKTTFTKLQAKLTIKKYVNLYKFTKKIKQEKSLKVKHDFNWTSSYNLSLEEAQEFRLIKGVAMTEGEMKSGDIFTENNLRHATGAMAASAMLGFAILDIDHYPDALPTDDTYSKYDVEKINEVYPLGFIIDAELSKNKAGTDGKELYQVEFIAVCENEYVYSMIKQGKFKACSVMDFPREYSCDNCNAETGVCTCDIAGSKFMYNTLVLEAVPDSDSTWVSIIDQKDIGSILKPLDTETKSASSIKNKIILLKSFRNNSIKHSLVQADVEKYRTDGVWNDGIESIKTFLIEEKGIDSEQAEKIANYINENPSALNTYQLQYLTGGDLISWFTNLNTIDRKQLHQFITNSHSLNISNKKSKSKRSHLLSKEEVNYRQGEEDSQCHQCRWFSTSDEEITPESQGICQIVEGDILGSDTCDRFEAIPTDTPPEDEPAAEEGGEESTIKTKKVIDDDAQQKELQRLEAAANIVPEKKEKVKATVTIETMPTSKINHSIEEIDKQINILISRRNDIGMIMGRGADQMKKQTQYDELTKEIKRLTLLKKNN